MTRAAGNRSRPRGTALLALGCWSALACSREAGRPVADQPSVASTRCFRSTASVLLGPPTSSGQSGQGPGWVRLESLQADSGAALLRDADGKALSGAWRREPGDSLRVVARDDFLRVELRAVVAPAGLQGHAEAHSDAALERDSAGRLVELRRSWTLAAAEAACDSTPTPKGGA